MSPKLVNKLQPLFAVVQRPGNDWTAAAKIIAVFPSEAQAELVATDKKQLCPQQHFGVFALRSEAREVHRPVEIVRAE